MSSLAPTPNAATHAKFNPLIRPYLVLVASTLTENTFMAAQLAALRTIEKRMDEIVTLSKERK